jgi:peptide deformylase
MRPDAEPLFLLNPRIVRQDEDQDEGRLSFFDVRGMVPRSRRIDVEHSDLDGERATTTYDHGMARLIAHEIDHLNGVLYLDRMRPGVEPIRVSQYRGTGAPWTY